MSQNPLLGKRISLISKKSIRYEGILYSINEHNATVALQTVRSFGTEGRVVAAEVPPSTDVHPYLLFRGQDIQDLHVHEEQPAVTATTTQEPAAAETAAPAPAPKPAPAPAVTPPPPNAPPPSGPKSGTENVVPPKTQKSNPSNNRRPRRNNNNNNIGTGASLLHRKARGAVETNEPQQPATDFDFATATDQFTKQLEEEEPIVAQPAYNAKNDFFDSISNSTTDNNNRLRGKEERQLNTETFGAVALNRQRRGGRGRGGGGRGGRGGRRGNNHRNNEQRRRETKATG